MPQIFQRQQFTQMWITLQSNETLGILDSGYLEDYYGTDGQITLYDTASFTRTAVIMTPLPLITPGIANDVFEGYVDLTTTPNGLYNVEGRVRDVLGNYSILSEVENPLGNEVTVQFQIKISATQISVLFPEAIPIMMGALFATHLPNIGVEFATNLIKVRTILSNMVTSGNLIAPVVEYTELLSGLKEQVGVETRLIESLDFVTRLVDEA